MIRWLSILLNSFLENFKETASGNVQRVSQAIQRCASRHFQFGQQSTPRATEDGKQCRVLKRRACGLRRQFVVSTDVVLGCDVRGSCRGQRHPTPVRIRRLRLRVIAPTHRIFSTRLLFYQRMRTCTTTTAKDLRATYFVIP